MDGSRFDALARQLGSASSRRRLLGGVVTGLASALIGRNVDAQSCRPAGRNCTGNASCCSGLCDTANPDPFNRNKCVCPPGTETCRGACANPSSDYLSDVDNCGACGNRCLPALNASATCSDGTCGTACIPGYMLCGGACVAAGGCCIGGAVVNAGTINPSNICQSCQPDLSTTGWSNRTNGAACNDGNACTQPDTCQADTCMPGPDVVTPTCPAPTRCQVSVSCNPANGECSQIVNKSAGASCGTASSCVGGVSTPGDECDGNGNCVSGGSSVACEPYACNSAGTSCTTTCDDELDCADCADCVSGSCTPPPATLLECQGRCFRDDSPNAVTRCGRTLSCPECAGCQRLCEGWTAGVGDGPAGFNTYCPFGLWTGQLCNSFSDCQSGEYCELLSGDDECRAVCFG